MTTKCKFEYFRGSVLCPGHKGNSKTTAAALDTEHLSLTSFTRNELYASHIANVQHSTVQYAYNFFFFSTWMVATLRVQLLLPFPLLFFWIGSTSLIWSHLSIALSFIQLFLEKKMLSNARCVIKLSSRTRRPEQETSRPIYIPRNTEISGSLISRLWGIQAMAMSCSVRRLWTIYAMTRWRISTAGQTY